VHKTINLNCVQNSFVSHLHQVYKNSNDPHLIDSVLTDILTVMGFSDDNLQWRMNPTWDFELQGRRSSSSTNFGVYTDHTGPSKDFYFLLDRGTCEPSLTKVAGQLVGVAIRNAMKGHYHPIFFVYAQQLQIKFFMVNFSSQYLDLLMEGKAPLSDEYIKYYPNDFTVLSLLSPTLRVELVGYLSAMRNDILKHVQLETEKTEKRESERKEAEKRAVEQKMTENYGDGHVGEHTEGLNDWYAKVENYPPEYLVGAEEMGHVGGHMGGHVGGHMGGHVGGHTGMENLRAYGDVNIN